jgi:hypothetical protein
MDWGILDKIDRITEFFGWSREASEARFHRGLQSILRAAAWGVDLIERRICGGNVADGKNKPLS